MSDLVKAPPSEASAALAFQTQTRITGTIKKMREAWVDLARDLYEFAENEMWRDLGYTSMNAWMADPDIEIEARWGYLLMQMHREFVIKQGATAEEMRKIEPSKAQVVLPALRRGNVRLDVALSDCETLGRDDLRERYHGTAAKQTPAGRAPDESTRLNSEAEPQWATCSECGSRYPLVNIDI